MRCVGAWVARCSGWRCEDCVVAGSGRRPYARAVLVLKHFRRAANAADQSEWFATCLADLRERHRRSPTLIAMLDKAGLG